MSHGYPTSDVLFCSKVLNLEHMDTKLLIDSQLNTHMHCSQAIAMSCTDDEVIIERHLERRIEKPGFQSLFNNGKNEKCLGNNEKRRLTLPGFS